jgi:itaconate CoA-transferase
VSLFDVIAEWMAVPLLFFDYTGAAPANVGLAHPSIAPYGAFTTADGRALIVSIQNDREWRDFAAAILGDVALGTEARFATNLARVANRAELERLIQACFAVLSFDAMTARLAEARIAFGAVNDVAALSRHPQLRRASVMTEQGSASVPAHPARMATTRAYGAVPSLGQHSAAIRQEFGDH